MDRGEVLAAYNDQVRRNPAPDAGGGIVERDATVVRCVSSDEGWRGVSWSELDEDTADDAIAAQIRRFAEVPGPWEWKHHSYDLPSDLPERLLAAGFVAEPAEALLIASIDELALDTRSPAGVELVEVAGADGVAELVHVHDRVFGGDHAALGRALLTGLEHEPPTASAVVARAGGQAIAAGRVEFYAGTDFAGLWGGGTVAEWRGRGVFRALVAHRAARAAQRGFRYLQVDASPASRPILKRLGFVELATTTPFSFPSPPE